MYKYIPLLASVILLSCAPVTSYNSAGQLQLDTSSKSQSPELVATGVRTFEVYKRSKKRVSNSQVSRVASRIQRVVNLPGAQWEFVTFENSVPNAFALPGGKVGIHTGILPIAKTDAGLAAIVAHEIAHVTRGHHASQQRRQKMVGLGGIILNQALGGGNQNAIDTVGQVAINLPNSRAAEIEADQVGLIYMARAGYNPNEAIGFWERFSAYKGSQGQQSSPLFSTHPLDNTRIAKLKKALPLAMAEYNKNRR